MPLHPRQIPLGSTFKLKAGLCGETLRMYRGRSGKRAVTRSIVPLSKGDGPIRVCVRAGKIACFVRILLLVYAYKASKC